MPGYFGVMGIPLRAGRDISDDDISHRRRVVIVDERLAALLWNGEAVGKQLGVGEAKQPLEVVGVAGQIRAREIRDSGTPMIYVPSHVYEIEQTLVVKTRAPLSTIGPAIKQAVEALGPGRPVFDIRLMDDIVQASIDNTRFTMLVLSGFAVASLVLAGVGLYGTLAYLTSQRTQEFGVRLALGASAASILRLVIREGCSTHRTGRGARACRSDRGYARAAGVAVRRHAARWPHHRERRRARCHRCARRRRLAGLARGPHRSRDGAARGVDRRREAGPVNGYTLGPDAPGTGPAVGVYEIVGSLGAGGMGEVYQARDTRLGRLVAIKFVSDELAADRTASERLAREAKLTSLLNHPNIVTVHDVGEMDGRPFIVMEFVAGQSLHSALEWERLKLGRVIEIASQVADGLTVAHAAGIVHRDLKPRNIMLTEDGRAKIVDFGVGKTNRPAPGAEDPTIHAGGLTDTSVVVGTAGYMAPEQVTSKPIDFRADQFALGAILYEMITGRRAFKRETAVQTMAAIVDTEPESLAELAPDTPIELVTIVDRCLAKDPAKRYASTQDLARDLREVPVLPGTRTSRSSFALKPARRRRWPWVAGLVALVGVAAAAAFLLDESDGPAARAGARAARSVRQAAERGSGHRPALVRCLGWPEGSGGSCRCWRRRTCGSSSTSHRT